MVGGLFDGDYTYKKTILDSFLTIGDNYWTMTPVGYYNPYGANTWIFAFEFYVFKTGFLDDRDTTIARGLRPVINLKNTLKFTGDGTKNNPYVPSL